MARSKKPAVPSIDSKTITLFEDKLISSGLTLADAAILHMEPITGVQTFEHHKSFKNVSSLKINYLDPFGEPLPDWPCCKPFYRLRYLEEVYGADKKLIRYVQEPSTIPVAYYPANYDWPLAIDNPYQPIILTEGELKAAKACKEGFPTIGLGGVWNWKSNEVGTEWIESLTYVNWARRTVYICFDSDMQTNPNICAALNALAESLQARGAYVRVISLPLIDGLDKVGLDDFLVHAGSEEFEELLAQAEPLGRTGVLFDFNNKYIFIKSPPIVLDLVSGNKMTPTVFRDCIECTKQYQEKVLKADGTISNRVVSAAGEWFKWPLRYEANNLTYKPGAKRYLDGLVNQYNIWPGWGVQPKAGDVQPFLDLINHLFTGAPEEAKRWFLAWCAYPLQYPGVKMFTSAALWGRRHGTGKSFIGYTLGRIYGKNFTEITQTDIHNGFNEWAEAKQFVLGDDVTGSDKRQEADFLKKMITQNEIRINMKFMPTYVVPDCINYYFTSNQPDSFFLDDDDRRAFIHEVTVGPLPEEFYVDYELWLDTGGSAAVFDWLLHYDTGTFNPSAPAFMTAAKERMISDGQSDLGGWVRQLIATPDFYLRLGEIPLPQDLYSSKELLQLYDPIGKTRTTANGLSRELKRAGLNQVCQGFSIKTSDGSQNRYYAIRNLDRWASATPAEVANHLNNTTASQPKPKY